MEILTREESTKYVGQTVTFQPQEITEIKNSIRAAWATLFFYTQELASKIALSSTSGSLIRHGDHFKLFNRRSAKCSASSYKQKRKYKKKTQDKNESKVIEEVGKPENEKDGEEERESNGSPKVKLVMETAQTPMKDADEEIDTAEIGEQDWIEHMKRSTDEAVERMKTAKSNADSKHTEE